MAESAGRNRELRPTVAVESEKETPMPDETVADETEQRRRVRERAFQIWVDEGKPAGKDKEHWDRAEAELAIHGGAPLQPDLPIGEVTRAEEKAENKG
jgi:hypothetical protein